MSSKTITEGKATVTFVGGETSVFYNPVQEFNRDLSILVLRKLARDRLKQSKCDSNDSLKDVKRPRIEEEPASGISILEALSASGLRSIRYAKEVQGVGKILANDFSRSAFDCIKHNIETNGVENLVSPSLNDAVTVMHEHKILSKRFDVVDLDPYGSPAHFLDGAVQCVSDGGILMVTCTDMAVLCGNTPEACFAKYGATSIKSKCCHELALRILIHCIQSHANRYGRYVEPLLCIHVDFYVRVFVRLHSGAQKAKISCCETSMLNQCCGCQTSYMQPLCRKTTTEKGGTKFMNHPTPIVTDVCDQCDNRFHLAGPIWSGKLHNIKFVQELMELATAPCSDYDQNLGTIKRITGILSVIVEELPDAPLFYSLSWMGHIFRVPMLPLITFRSAILNAGFKVSSTHVDPMGIKTDAPAHLVWDIMRCWARQNNCQLEKISPQSPGFKIFGKAPKFNADFTIRTDAEPISRKSGALRFQQNPQKNWGPKMRAKGSAVSGLKNTTALL